MLVSAVFVVSVFGPQAASASADADRITMVLFNISVSLTARVERADRLARSVDRSGAFRRHRRCALDTRSRDSQQETTMSIFGNIMGKVFGHKSATASASTPTQAPATPQPQASAPAAEAAPAAAPQQPVDVGAVLSEMASMKSGGGNYQSSIVDLLKLLDLDSSLSARKELGQELGVHAGEDGSAEQNIALHKAVMDKLAENGGIVPDSLRN